MTDLWPDDIGYPDLPKSPVVILKEQASLLGKRTRNLVEAEATPRAGHGNKFAYNFNIVAPTLGPYKYLLFWIMHDVELYPVRIIVPDDIAVEITRGSRNLEANSEEELMEWLKLILGAEKTRKVIQALLVQVRGSFIPEFDEEGIEPVRTLAEAPPSPTRG